MRTFASSAYEGPLVAEWKYAGTAEHCCICTPPPLVLATPLSRLQRA